MLKELGGLHSAIVAVGSVFSLPEECISETPVDLSPACPRLYNTLHTARVGTRLSMSGEYSQKLR